MELRVFLAVLLLYENNFRLLHWKAKGPYFKIMHEQADELYNKIHQDIDRIAEMTMRMGQNPPDQMEGTKLLIDYEGHEFKAISSSDDFEFEEFCSNVDRLLNDIIYCIEELLENSEEIKSVKNIGIKSYLEGMHDSYDLQVRYLNARQMGKSSEDTSDSEDSDDTSVTVPGPADSGTVDNRQPISDSKKDDTSDKSEE